MTPPDDPFRLDGKVALVTGAARGIGAACAETLAAAGATVMVSDVLTDLGDALAARIGAGGGRAEFISLDVTSEPAWEQVLATTVEHLGGLDVVVNNAGVEFLKPLAETELADWHRLFAVNVDGVFLGIKHAIRTMMPRGKAGRGGSIINLSSVAGLIGFAGGAAYSASKGAVRLLSKSAALECAQGGLGIRVNSVHPGVVQTGMAESLSRELVTLGLVQSPAEGDAFMKELHPLGVLGEPADVAHVVQFLASDASRWVTGSEYVVDGGLTAR